MIQEEFQKIKDEIEKIESSNNPNKKNDVLRVINKYGLEYTPTDKGRTLYKKLLSRFYKGDRLSANELILIGSTSVYDVEVNSSMITDEITHELLSKHDIDLNDDITFAPMLLSKGLIKPNPFIIPEFANIVNNVFNEVIQHES